MQSAIPTTTNPTFAKTFPISRVKLQELFDAISKELPTCTDAKFSSFVQGRVIRVLADLIREGERNSAPNRN